MPNTQSIAHPSGFHSLWRNVFPFAITAAAWILSNPYHGIRHDGILYLGQALFCLYPETFQKDIFFQYGSQANFTLFPLIEATSIDLFGIGPGIVLLLVVGQIAFFITLFWCLRLFLRGPYLWLGLLFVGVFPHDYGGLGVFSYGENFLTARTLAEPLCLYGLGLALRDRVLAATIAFIVAFAIHPLMTVPAILLWWIWASLRTPALWWLAVAGLLPVALSILAIEPFSLLTKTYDDLWWEGVRLNNGHTLLSLWEWQDWQRLFFDIAIMWLGIQLAGPRLRTFLKALILMAIAGLLVSGLGADLLRNVLITGLQLWRVHWLLHLFAIALVPWCCLHLLRSGVRVKRVGALLVSVALLALDLPGGGVALIVALALLRWDRVTALRLSRGVEWLVRLSFLVVVLMVIGRQAWGVSLPSGTWAEFGAGWSARLAQPAFLGLLGTTLLLWQAHRFGCILKGVVAAALLGFGLSHADQRSGWPRYVESHFDSLPVFQAYLRPGDQVYWQSNYYGLLGSWVLLKHPCYLTDPQGAGLLFNRSTALEFMKRSSVFKRLTIQEAVCAIQNSLEGGDRCRIDEDLLDDVCSRSPGLGAFISESHFSGRVAAEWSLPLPDGQGGKSFYLYLCPDQK